MYKRLVTTVLFFFMIGCSILHAQTWDEWFRQKKTQVKYLVEQIAALQVYIGFVEKGYNIANEGLSAIRDIKNGDFHLHDGYFSSLKNVNPKIKESVKVAGIISLQLQIVQQEKNIEKTIQQQSLFSASEISYLHDVSSNLLAECAANMEVLVMLVSDGNAEMKDDERLQRIENLYKDMQDKYSFACAFNRDVVVLGVQRNSEQAETTKLKKMYGLP